MAGYGATNNSALTAMDLAILNAIGDFLDLVPALNPSLFPNYDAMSPEELQRAVRGESWWGFQGLEKETTRRWRLPGFALDS